MKTYGICPKCSSKKIAVIPSEPGTYNAIKIDMFDFAKLTRYVCAECGYIEQFVSDVKSLQKLQQKTK